MKYDLISCLGGTDDISLTSPTVEGKIHGITGCRAHNSPTERRGGDAARLKARLIWMSCNGTGDPAHTELCGVWTSNKSQGPGGARAIGNRAGTAQDVLVAPAVLVISSLEAGGEQRRGGEMAYGTGKSER